MAKVEAGMAGNVWKVLVKEGDQVEAGQEVVILESMKMEIPVSVEEGGTIAKVYVQEGDFVNDSDTIVDVE
ncbi:acetyl-CoA carboxylase biotin carboxyl carrier protein subunit [Mesobacillus maritimus]|jgi:acetyl-CoA carboxylase biotin carboxyl carrier protein|uniref:Acetyl-CoA carboxylase biotin carboxyl carrier protein subunit n=1 Tax=Mesobacillus maritimus TaxID=1643336 RepID=A0ABS7JZW0_9BACI|nr:acetyl-CoA carboxylase biotin carboxyl carrier protein subunit [Mesobacillus maritimus]MBY0095530.1 acetyl-CoA carboxylase biotin carboxyl carrier protein subunit [Mesobacillus maritimus]